MEKTLFSAMAAVLISTCCASASATATFTVNEGSVPGANANVFTADSLHGTYFEVLTIHPGNTYDAIGFARFNAFFNTGSMVTGQQLDGNPPNGYSLYATFAKSGLVSGGTLSGTSGSFELFLDPNQDTQLFIPSGTSVARAGQVDDYLFGFSTQLLSATGTSTSFTSIFDGFQLTPSGTLYFTSPAMFYSTVTASGNPTNVQIFDLIDQFAPGRFTVAGDLSATFAVPEPSALALVALALAGAGVVGRLHRRVTPTPPSACAP